MKERISIPLTKDKHALVDAEDADRVLAHSWHALKVHRRWYAATVIEGRRVYLHQFILPGALEVDHKDRDGLNNTKGNLRSCTHSQNIANAEFPIGRSGYRGVNFDNRRGSVKKPWYAMIKVMQKRKNLGHFSTAEEAARAYDKAAREAWGEFAWQNFHEKVGA